MFWMMWRVKFKCLNSPPVAKSKKLSTKLFGLYNDESIISQGIILKRCLLIWRLLSAYLIG